MRLAAAEEGVHDSSSDGCIMVAAEKIVLAALCWQSSYVGIVRRTSRSFAEMVTDKEELAARVADFAAGCAAKLREEKSAACKVTVFLWTNRFREDLDQYYPSVSIVLPVAASSTQEIVAVAVKGLGTIYRDGYMYKKAGVIVDGIVDEDAVQTTMFGYDMETREREDKLSHLMDSLNASGRNVVRLASQNQGGYASGIRSGHRSRQYSTSWDELLEVK